MKLKSKISVGQDKLGCGMEMNHQDHKDQREVNHCCDNEFVPVDVTDDYQSNANDYTLDVPIATIILFTYFNIVPVVPEKPLFPVDISPPSQHQDRQVLYQTFLI